LEIGREGMGKRKGGEKGRQGKQRAGKRRRGEERVCLEIDLPPPGNPTVHEFYRTSVLALAQHGIPTAEQSQQRLITNNKLQ